MNNNIEQNGRQQPSAPPSDPRIKNSAASDQQKFCRDYVWGKCSKGSRCRFLHELDWEFMRDTLKFCHDHQNKTGCTRPGCTYLHTTIEEQKLFLTTKEIPRALAERYAAMSSMNMVAEGFPQGVYEYMAPPPPRLSTSLTGVGPMPPNMMAGGLPPLMHMPMAPVAAPLPSLLTPPPPLLAPTPLLLAPPPPPPLPPLTVSSTTDSTTAVYTAPPPLATPSLTNSQPAPAPFDPTRPPPPLSTTLNNGVKRSSDTTEVGPCKSRKVDDEQCIDSPCESCTQWESRIKMIRDEMKKLESECEYQSYILDKKMEEYDNGKLLLKSVINPDLYRVLDDYVESTSQTAQVSDLLTQYNQTPSLNSGATTAQVPKQFLLKLMECAFNNQHHILGSESPSSGVDESSLLQSLSTLARRANPIQAHTSPDLLQAVAEVLRNGEVTAALLERLNDDIKEKLPHLTKEKGVVSSQQSVYTSVIAMANITTAMTSRLSQSVETRTNVTPYESRLQMAVEPPVNVLGSSGVNGQKIDSAVPAQPPIRPNVHIAPPGNTPTGSPQYVHPPVTVPPRAAAPQHMPRPSASAPPPLSRPPQTPTPYGMPRYPPHFFPPYQ